MAVNALVIRNGIPVPVNREQFLHMDEGLSIEIGSNNIYRGKGKVYLTNFRLIFLKRDPSREFSSFSLPYMYIIKHKYNKKLLGGPVISGTVKSVINGGLPNNAKWYITFNDSNTGKAFYSLFEKELKKLNNPYDNLEKYKRVINTPTLSVQEIFPDQYAQYQRQKRLKQQGQQKNIVLGMRNQQHNNYKSNKSNRQIIVGQSAEDAPMQLTDDFRAQKAKLFSSASKSNALGPVTGASPVNIHAFATHRIGKTTIQDESTKYDASPPPENVAAAAPAASQEYNAYVDPSNPDDIVLSVPINDNQFEISIEDEGKSNDNYMYGIGAKYEQKHNAQNSNQNYNNNNKKTGKNIAVLVGVDDDDEDDFQQRPKVQPAGIGMVNNNNNNNKKVKKVKQKPPDLNDLFSQSSSGSLISNDSPIPIHKNQKQKVVDNPWADDASTSINDALLSGNNGNAPTHWQQFASN